MNIFFQKKICKLQGKKDVNNETGIDDENLLSPDIFMRIVPEELNVFLGKGKHQRQNAKHHLVPHGSLGQKAKRFLAKERVNGAQERRLQTRGNERVCKEIVF